MMDIKGLLNSVSYAKILVVDDDMANTLLIGRILSHVGLQDVVVCNDSRDFKDLLAELNPDLVMLDLHMPHVDGFELLETISAHARSVFLPVIVLTGDTTRDALHRAFALGAHDFLIKPLDAVEVALRIRNQLRIRFAYQALHDGNREMRNHLSAIRSEDEGPWESRRARIEAVLVSSDPTVVFQPIVELTTGACVGFEALSRFATTPTRSPNLWFDEASGVGLGLELEVKTTRLALKALDLIPPDCFLSLNVSPAAVIANLRRHLPDDIDWGRVVFEITEHTMIEDYDALARSLKPFRTYGARLSADDAGAGYASMRHILELGPDIIKVDISITRAIDKDPRRRALASALAAFATHIDAELVAEGIETPAEMETLKEIGVRYGQGYLLGRPGPL